MKNKKSTTPYDTKTHVMLALVIPRKLHKRVVRKAGEDSVKTFVTKLLERAA